MSITIITKDNFASEVTASEKPVLIDFWASWCGPCRMIAPMIDEIAEEENDIKVGKINIDEEPELAAAYNIMSIPTVALFREGQIVSVSVGVRPKDAILEMLK